MGELRGAGFLSVLDMDMLHIETRKRPLHFCFVLRLASSPDRQVTIEQLRRRVLERVAQREIFQVCFQRRGLRAPLIETKVDDASSIRVREVQVAGDSDVRFHVGQMLAAPWASGRLWDVTLLTNRDTGVQDVVMRVHHCLADGVSAAGFGYLVVDGDDKALGAFDRFLVSPRFTMFDVDGPTLWAAAKQFAASWWQGAFARHPRTGRVSSTRIVDYFVLSAAAMNQAARARGVSQMAYLLASISMEMSDIAKARGDRATVARTMIPITMDLSLRHTGNAMAFALVNLDLTAGSFDDALGHVTDQLQKVARNSPNYVLRTLTQNAEGPWLYKQAASRALMSAVRPDLDVGITPLSLKFDSVLGIPVDAVYPISPLIYTPISIAVLLLGDRLTVGINTDASAVGGIGHMLAQRLHTRLTNQ